MLVIIITLMRLANIITSFIPISLLMISGMLVWMIGSSRRSSRIGLSSGVPWAREGTKCGVITQDANVAVMNIFLSLYILLLLLLPFFFWEWSGSSPLKVDFEAFCPLVCEWVSRLLTRKLLILLLAYYWSSSFLFPLSRHSLIFFLLFSFRRCHPPK